MIRCKSKLVFVINFRPIVFFIGYTNYLSNNQSCQQLRYFCEKFFMIKFIKKIMWSFSWILAIGFIIGIQSCKKNNNNENSQNVVFSFTAPDTLTFEYTGSEQLAVAVQNSGNYEFGASLTGLNGSFSDGSQQLVIPSNQERFFNINFYQNNAVPGIYPCQLTVAVFNVNNNASQTKNIQLVYAPNCAYNYRNYLNGEITYQINGILLNKNINCAYNDQGQLVVNNLTTFPVVLNFNCQAQTFTMQPLTHLGFFVTGDGYIQGQNIVLNIYNDGILDAVALIKP